MLIRYSIPLIAITLCASSLYAESTQPQQKPSAYPCPTGFDPHCLKEDCGFWVDGELLFWQSNMNGLDYALKSESTTSIRDGKVKDLDFDWSWGARLGIGYKIPHDKWDLFLNYTYVHGKASNHTSTNTGAIYPTWSNAYGLPSGAYATHAKAHWNMNLNMGDLELGRTCMIGKFLSIRPFMGVRALFIDQDFAVDYAGGTAFPSGKDHVRMNNDFWGVGLRLGADSLWALGAGFSIYGNGSVSLLSGHFNVHEKEKQTNPKADRLDVRYTPDPVVVTADVALGLQWDYMFSKDRFHFGVKFGWEFNMFFDQNQLFNFVSSSLPGSVTFQDDDLSFQGLTLGFRFDF
ncbi:MAG: hypothetical protein JSS61_06310 [Verrucomicrobia bacterium]|nr:hypothetical protein [Verrucomicrobiota bacterium]